MKNIPVSGKNAYMKIMMEKMESLVRRMRWKALFFEKPEMRTADNNTYGFNSNKSPPQMELIVPFENDLYDLVSNIRFSPRRNEFQKQLSKDVREIALSKNVLVSADKTPNLYSVTSEEYKKLLDENITKSYKKSGDDTKQVINREGKAITTSLDLADRMEVYAEKKAFITLKDHKENFRSRPSCRLINPAKSEVGIVSKQIIEKVNDRVRGVTQLQQWKNTYSVIDWFSNLPDREGKTFIKFDIVEFYPSISEDLLKKAMIYAKSIVDITEQEESIIWHSRKSLLFSDSSTWIKKDGSLFDVTMGSFDGAEICELVGLYLLHLLSSTFSQDLIGLYRDDGLAALNLSGPESDRARKDIIRIFKDCGLRVTVETLLKQTDFLDVTFDLPTGRYWPYRKPNSDPLYIHAKSNHPPSITKHLPAAICNRLSSISCNVEEFDKAKPPYEEALRKSGHDAELTYKEPQRTRRQQRKRNIIWFNPPYNQNVTTNVAHKFLALVDKHFPRNHRYHKLFNRNNVKVSYSCMKNMAAIISSHNHKVLSPRPTQDPRQCNCRQPDRCPLKGHCLTECIVYKATVSVPNKPNKHYYGLTEGPFKTRFNGHTHSFRTESCRRETELSKYIWELKDRNQPYEIAWDIERRASPYKCGTRRCDICLSEKMVIALADPLSTLNKRAEIISTCRHRAKFRYSKVSSAPM